MQNDVAIVIWGLIVTYLPRFLRLTKGSLFLLGPRGTGKTTLLRRRLTDALHLNLLRPEIFRELKARPERVPELLNVVHDLIESGAGHRFVLTGSSARKLRRGGIDQALDVGTAAASLSHLPPNLGLWPRSSEPFPSALPARSMRLPSRS